MYKKVVYSIAGLAMLASTPTAFADRGEMYFGVDLLNWTYTQSGNSGGSTGVRGVFGQQLSDIIGWEAQLATGGTSSIPPYGNVEMNALGGGYLRINVPLGRADLHALVGFGSGSFSNASSWTFQSGLSYGFGGQVKISKKTALRADYMQNVSSTNWEAKSVTFGANFYF